MGIRQVKMFQTSTLLAEGQPFFLDKCSSDYGSLLVNFQSSEKVHFDNFVIIFVASVEEQIIHRGSHSPILTVPRSSIKASGF